MLDRDFVQVIGLGCEAGVLQHLIDTNLNLTSVSLSDARIGRGTVVESLGGLKFLTHLKITGHTRGQNAIEDVSVLFQILNWCLHLTSLTYAGSTDDILAAGALPLDYDQEPHTVLQSLDLGEWYVDHPNIIPAVLELVPNLEELKLPSIWTESQDTLVGPLAYSSIRKLTLHNFQFKNGAMSQKILSQQAWTELQLLECSGISTQGMNAMTSRSVRSMEMLKVQKPAEQRGNFLAQTKNIFRMQNMHHLELSWPLDIGMIPPVHRWMLFLLTHLELTITISGTAVTVQRLNRIIRNFCKLPRIRQIVLGVAMTGVLEEEVLVPARNE
ncbi:hypothetical protein BGZ74_004408, partial [Mortierella antarctica]